MYLLFLMLYLLCASATIVYPKLPPIGNPGFQREEIQRDRCVVGHSLGVMGVAIYAVLNVKDWHVNIESMGLASLIIHGYLFQFGRRLSKNFWHWFIFGFDFLLIAGGIFLASMH